MENSNIDRWKIMKKNVLVYKRAQEVNKIKIKNKKVRRQNKSDEKGKTKLT